MGIQIDGRMGRDEQSQEGQDRQLRSRHRLYAFLLLTALLLAALSYWAPWVDHDTAALKLSGQDLGEFVKFVPAVRSGQVRFPRQLFYLPPLACVLCLVLAGINRRLPYPRWLRIAVLGLALLLLPGLLPPVWGHPRELFAAEFRLQGLALVFGALFVLAHGLFRSIPLRHLAGYLVGLSLLGLLPAQGAFWAIKPRIWAAYGTPTIRLGWGVWIEILAWVAAGGLAVVLARSEPLRRDNEKNAI